jgi:hypothetical protein
MGNTCCRSIRSLAILGRLQTKQSTNERIINKSEHLLLSICQPSIYILTSHPLRMASNSPKETECGEKIEEEVMELISIEIGLLDLVEVEAQV